MVSSRGRKRGREVEEEEMMTESVAMAAIVMEEEEEAEKKEEEWELKPTSLPNDIALAIASFLCEASDVCSLGSCSKFWYGLCSSDCLWLHLSTNRWPHLHLHLSPHPPQYPNIHTTSNSNNFQGWRPFYITMHERFSACASIVIKFVEQCINNESLEVGNFLKAVGDLRSMNLGFKDVQLFFLAKKCSVMLNLIGLHYSIFCLGIPLNDVMEALDAREVADRQVCVSWFKLGRWFYGFRLPDEHRSRKVSLGELATAEGEEVLGVLNRGVVHEVLRVHIKAANVGTVQPSHSLGPLC